MGKVRLEHDVVLDQIDHPSDRIPLEPERAVDLTFDVEARELELGPNLERAVALPVPVEGLHHKGKPAGAAFHRDEVDPGVAMAQPGTDDVTDPPDVP